MARIKISVTFSSTIIRSPRLAISASGSISPRRRPSARAHADYKNNAKQRKIIEMEQTEKLIKLLATLKPKTQIHSHLTLAHLSLKNQTKPILHNFSLRFHLLCSSTEQMLQEISHRFLQKSPFALTVLMITNSNTLMLRNKLQVKDIFNNSNNIH